MKILAIETSCDETAVSVLSCEGGIENASFTVIGDALYSQAEKHAEYGGVYPNLAKREHQLNLATLATEAMKHAGMLREAQSDSMIYHTTETGAVAEKIEALRDPEFKKTVVDFLSQYEKPNIDLIAVTKGPGLEPALWTGITFAEALGSAWNIPVAGIDHMEGHIVSALLKRVTGNGLQGTEKNSEPETYYQAKRGKRKQVFFSERAQGESLAYNLKPVTFPLLSLLVSGGHTELVVMKSWFDYEMVGETRDDAVGEAFDKVARLLDLSYPGGPKIAEFAEKSRSRSSLEAESSKLKAFSFPRPMIADATCDFSFSGLKTAVLYKLKTMERLSETDKESIAEEFENATRDIITTKTGRALKKVGAQTLAVGGGVSANKEIRKGLEKLVKEDFPEMHIHFPEEGLTGDNAIMIGAVAYLRHTQNVLTFEKNIAASGTLRRGAKI